jgi:DNA polymerase
MSVATLVAACTRCPLHLTRTNPVPGEGNPKAQLMLVGEGPGETEDRLGRPFVGGPASS